MKKLKFLLPIITLLALTSCDSFPFDFPGKDNPSENENNNNNNNNNNSDINDTHRHTFETAWSRDNEYHWHAATCEHKDEKQYKGAHVFSDWSVEFEPTKDSSGTKWRYCNTCRFEEREVIPALERDGLSIEEALTVPEFIEKCMALKPNEVSDKEYYVAGKVSNFTYNEKYESYSFYFDGYKDIDDKYSAYVYSAVLSDEAAEKINGANFDGKNVIVKGYLKNYQPVSGQIMYEIAYLNAASSPTGSAVSPTIVDILDDNYVQHTHTYADVWSKDETFHWYPATCEHTDLYKSKAEHSFGRWITTVKPTATTSGSKVRSCLYCGYDEYETIDPNDKPSGTFTLYTFNDFHGAVNQYEDTGHAGLAAFGTYLKNLSKEENTLIVDSGDTFQGSIESNSNYGAMITDVFNYSHVDVHTLGNHDFDWGEDKIEDLRERKAPDGWKMTNLAANIYDYNFSTHTEGTKQQSRLGERYYIKTLDNGMRVAVIGVIGAEQITSICSPLVEDICFKDEVAIAQSVSDEIRSKNLADFVIVSVHGSANDTINRGLAEVSPVTGKKYADYVACAHSHQNEMLKDNDIYYTQASAYGERVYRCTFEIEFGEVKRVDIGTMTYTGIINAAKNIDPNITSIINNYAKDYSSLGGQVLAKASGTFSRTNQLPNLLAKAVYEEANSQGYNVNIAITNNARYDIRNASSITYSQMYEAFPFDNLIYIVKVKGSKNINQLCYSENFYYHKSTLSTLNDSGTYTVAIIDYLLFHTNQNRYYDYYNHNSGNVQILGILKQSNGNNYLYRDIAADYMKKQTKTIYASDYAKTLAEFTTPTH